MRTRIHIQTITGTGIILLFVLMLTACSNQETVSPGTYTATFTADDNIQVDDSLMTGISSMGCGSRRRPGSHDFPLCGESGAPFYARMNDFPPHIFADGEWAVIYFYRDPSCIPAGFNLLQFFDFGGRSHARW